MSKGCLSVTLYEKALGNADVHTELISEVSVEVNGALIKMPKNGVVSGIEESDYLPIRDELNKHFILADYTFYPANEGQDGSSSCHYSDATTAMAIRNRLDKHGQWKFVQGDTRFPQLPEPTLPNKVKETKFQAQAIQRY